LKNSSIIITGAEEYRKLTGDSLAFPGAIFYHPEFLEIAACVQKLNYNPVVFKRDNEILAIANILQRKKFTVRSSTIPHLFQYYGPLILKNDPQIASAIEKHLRPVTDTAIFSITPELTGVGRFPGWRIYPRLTYYLAPDSYENMKTRCDATFKKKLNKAAAADLTISQIDKFPWHIYEATFSRKKLAPPLDRQTTCDWVEKLTARGFAATYMIEYEGEMVAFRTELVYNEYASDWLAGSLYDFPKIGINQFLMLKIGEILFRKGISHWDLSGGDIEGVRQFKRSFGAEAKAHIQLEKSFSIKGWVYRKAMKLKARSND